MSCQAPKLQHSCNEVIYARGGEGRGRGTCCVLKSQPRKQGAAMSRPAPGKPSQGRLLGALPPASRSPPPASQGPSPGKEPPARPRCGAVGGEGPAGGRVKGAGRGGAAPSSLSSAKGFVRELRLGKRLSGADPMAARSALLSSTARLNCRCLEEKTPKQSHGDRPNLRHNEQGKSAPQPEAIHWILIYHVYGSWCSIAPWVCVKTLKILLGFRTLHFLL